MDDAALVRVLDGVADVQQQTHATAHVETRIVGVAHEIGTRDELHREVGLRSELAVDRARLVDLGDARVLEPREDVRLVLEALEVRGRHALVADELQRDATARPLLLGDVHDAHTASADPLADPIAGDRGARGIRHRGRGRDELVAEEIRELPCLRAVHRRSPLARGPTLLRAVQYAPVGSPRPAATGEARCMDERASHAGFGTTRWSMIDRARMDPAAMERLLAVYWRPIYAFLRRSGRQPADAADLTQGFIERVVLDRGLVDRADAERGRFRALLKTALRNFVVDEHRAARGAHRSIVPLDEARLGEAEPGADESPGDAFDRQWAITVLEQAMARLEEECRAQGLDRHWTVFHAQVVAPSVSGAAPPSAAELAERFGLDDVERVHTMVQVVRRRLRRVLRDVVAEVATGEEEVEAELRAVWQSL